MHIWDYKIEKGWKPQTVNEWVWFLERKINYDDWKGLNPKIIKKYFTRLKIHPGKKLMLDNYFHYYGTK